MSDDRLDDRRDPCPECGGELEYDEVDIGVGILRGNPGCPYCGWTPAPLNIVDELAPFTEAHYDILRRRGMVATKESELDGLHGEAPTSCLGKAADDEPIFILRAQDRTSSKVVRAWVQAARDAGCVNETKLEEALEWALAAEKWRETHGGGKVPD